MSVTLSGEFRRPVRVAASVVLMTPFDPRIQSQRAEEIHREITNKGQGNGADND